KSLANAYVYSNAVAGQTIADFYEPRVEILTGDGQHQASTATATEAATLSNIAYRKSDFALRHENTLVVSYLDGHVDAITKAPDILPVRAGLQLWLNPESLANQGLQDGDRVKTWQDSSKDNNYCTINIPNWYPVMTANSLNGFPSIRVASSKNQQLFSQGSPKLDTNTLSWWCVGRTDSAPADRCQILLRTRYKVGCTLKDASDAMWGCFVQNGNFTVHARNGNCNNIQNVFSYAGYEGKFVSLNGIWNATTFTGYFNGKPGTPVDNIQCSPSGNIGVTLAGWGHTDGNIAEVIVYNRALNDQERHAVERYLNDKYQLY
ncbi:MAG TPA: hypothetical protein VHV83_02780, partial [Armatimonadota bacterium]|nr:hypothetical protein [Armatimonadota bacterium]